MMEAWRLWCLLHGYKRGYPSLSSICLGQNRGVTPDIRNIPHISILCSSLQPLSIMSVYEIVVPLFISGLETYDHILEQTEVYAKEKGLDVDATFFEARLIEDQLPLKFQVQNTTSLAQINLGRLIGEEITPFEKDEKTVADLRKRVQKTIEFLKAADPSKAAGKETSEVDL